MQLATKKSTFSKFSAVLFFLITATPLASANTVLGFTSNIESNCHSETWNTNTKFGNCTLGSGDYPRWTVNGVHENAAFKQGASGDIRLADPIVDVDFVPRADIPGRYEVEMTLDKINYPAYLDHQGRDVRTGFTALHIADTPYARNSAGKPIFDLSDDVYVQVSIDLENIEQTILPHPAWVGNAEIRIILAMQAWWGGYKHTIEVNLMRTSKFDRCGPVNVLTQPNHPNFPYTWRPLLNEIGASSLTAAHPNGLGLGPVCDPSNMYDHRFVSLDGSGTINKNHVTSESVYYNVANLPFSPQTPLSTGTGYQTFTIPLSQLFRNYPWRVPPSSWSAVKSWDGNDPTEGYITAGFGLEIYGAGRADLKVKDFLLFTP